MAEVGSLVLAVDVQRLGISLQVSVCGPVSAAAGFVLSRTAAAFVMALDKAGCEEQAASDGEQFKELADEVARIRKLLERQAGCEPITSGS